jgi:hypothetical protein
MEGKNVSLHTPTRDYLWCSEDSILWFTQMLCPNLGSYAFLTIFAQESFHIKNRPQTFGMAYNMVSDAYGWRGHWIDMLQDFDFKILH